MVARLGRICKRGTGGGLEEGRRGRCDVMRAHGATLEPPPPVSDKTKGTRKVDIRLSGKGNSNSHGAGPVY